MITSIIRQLVFLVPIAYVLARYGQSIGNDDLVWWCYPIAEIASLGVTLLFFLRVYRTVIAKVPLDGAPSLEEEYAAHPAAFVRPRKMTEHFTGAPRTDQISSAEDVYKRQPRGP